MAVVRLDCSAPLCGRKVHIYAANIYVHCSDGYGGTGAQGGVARQGHRPLSPSASTCPAPYIWAGRCAPGASGPARRRELPPLPVRLERGPGPGPATATRQPRPSAAGARGAAQQRRIATPGGLWQQWQAGHSQRRRVYTVLMRTAPEQLGQDSIHRRGQNHSNGQYQYWYSKKTCGSWRSAESHAFISEFYRILHRSNPASSALGAVREHAAEEPPE